jgi:hypothetical protein
MCGVRWIMVLGAAVVALGFPGCETEPDSDHLLDELVAFARDPSDETWASVPLADRVQLGLGDRLLKTRSAHALRDPAAWMLNVDHFRGGVGRFSSLDVLAPYEAWPLEYDEGRHRRCASPPRPPPRPVLGLRQLSIQPREPASCLRWFAVDVFVDESGDIRAVTLDLWEP